MSLSRDATTQVAPCNFSTESQTGVAEQLPDGPHPGGVGLHPGRRQRQGQDLQGHGGPQGLGPVRERDDAHPDRDLRAQVRRHPQRHGLHDGGGLELRQHPYTAVAIQVPATDLSTAGAPVQLRLRTSQTVGMYDARRRRLPRGRCPVSPASRPRRPSADAGFTIIELSVAMALLALLITMTLTMVLSSREVFVAADDEATGQTTCGRRRAPGQGHPVLRGIDLGATASRLELWIDYDSDYRIDAAEIVTWQVQANGTGQFDVRRTEDGTNTITAETIMDQLAFCYRVSAGQPCLAMPLSPADAARVTVVETTMRYDARLTTGSNARNLIVVERLRNVG